MGANGRMGNLASHGEDGARASHERVIGQRPVAVIADVAGELARDAGVALARVGYDVAIIGPHDEVVRAAAMQVLCAGARAHAVTVEWFSGSKTAEAVAEIELHLGPIAAWVVLAAGRPSVQLDSSRADEGVATLMAFIRAVSIGEKALHDSGQARIVGVVPAIALRQRPIHQESTALAGAMGSYIDSVRTDLFRERSAVHVSSVVVPATLGETHAKTVRTIVAALRSDRRHHFVRAEDFIVDHLRRLVPGVCDHLLANSSELTTGSILRAFDDRLRQIVGAPLRINRP